MTKDGGKDDVLVFSSGRDRVEMMISMATPEGVPISAGLEERLTSTIFPLRALETGDVVGSESDGEAVGPPPTGPG